jgi:hypothetical protein
MAFQLIETSVQQLHQSRILEGPEGRLRVLRAIRLLKRKLKANLFDNFFELQEEEN